jgi:hypothetical protein
VLEITDKRSNQQVGKQTPKKYMQIYNSGIKSRQLVGNEKNVLAIIRLGHYQSDDRKNETKEMLEIIFPEFPNTVAIQAGDEEFVKRVAIPNLTDLEQFGHKSETNEMLEIMFQEFLNCSNTGWG